MVLSDAKSLSMRRLRVDLRGTIQHWSRWRRRGRERDSYGRAERADALRTLARPERGER